MKNLYSCLFLVLMIALLPIFGCNQMAEENTTIMTRLIEEGWNNKDFDVVNELCSSNYVQSTNGVKSKNQGPDVIIEGIKANENAYPDFKIIINDVFATDDKVVLRWSFIGTSANFNKSVNNPGTMICQIEDGKLVEGWQSLDYLNLYQTLGFKLTSPEASEED